MMRLSKTHLINIDPDKVREVFAKDGKAIIRYFDHVEISLTPANGLTADGLATLIVEGVIALWVRESEGSEAETADEGEEA